MGYSESLEAAGAKVIAYKQFGSYQGDWAAFVELNGEKVVITGSYGSCSGCDAFEAEFSWGDQPEERDGKYYYNYDEVTKEEFDQKTLEYNNKLSEFGASYLRNPSTKDILQTRLENLKKEDWFSEEEREMVEWCLKQFETN